MAGATITASAKRAGTLEGVPALWHEPGRFEGRGKHGASLAPLGIESWRRQPGCCSRRAAEGGGSASGPATATRSASPTASGAASSTPPAPAPSASPSSARQYPTRAQILSEFKNQRTGEFGLEVKGIELGLPTTTKSAALTFDACGGAHGSAIDHALLDTLRDHNVPATQSSTSGGPEATVRPWKSW